METSGKVGKADTESEGNGEEGAICEIRKEHDGGELDAREIKPAPEKRRPSENLRFHLGLSVKRMLQVTTYTFFLRIQRAFPSLQLKRFFTTDGYGAGVRCIFALKCPSPVPTAWTCDLGLWSPGK